MNGLMGKMAECEGGKISSSELIKKCMCLHTGVNVLYGAHICLF